MKCKLGGDLGISLHLGVRGFPGVPVVKNPPAIQETLIPPLGWEDPLEEEMASHSSIIVWRILCTEEFGGLLQSVES